jgi:hypothetical protein
MVKLTTPLPELLALNIPVKVAPKLSVPPTGTVWVMVSRSQTRKRDHESVAHSTQEGHRIAAAARATCTRESARRGESYGVSFGF